MGTAAIDWQARALAAEAWQAETRAILGNTAIPPAWRVMAYTLWEQYGAQIPAADPDTGELPIHLPELAAAYGRCEKQTGNMLKTMAAAGGIGYRVEKTQTKAGEYRNRARFRPPATTREAYCGVVAGWSHESGVGRPPVDVTAAELPLEMETQKQERLRYTTYTSGAEGKRRRVVKVDHTNWQNIGSPRLEVLSPDRAEIISHEIALTLLGELRGIVPDEPRPIPPDRHAWPTAGNNFHRPYALPTKNPTPPAEPEEWGREAWPLAP